MAQPDYYFPGIDRGFLCSDVAVSVALVQLGSNALDGPVLANASSLAQDGWAFREPAGIPVCHVTRDPSTATELTPPFVDMTVFSLTPDTTGANACRLMAAQTGLIVSDMEGLPMSGDPPTPDDVE